MVAFLCTMDVFACICCSGFFCVILILSFHAIVSIFVSASSAFVGFFPLRLHSLWSCPEFASLEAEICPWILLDLLCQGVYLLQCRYQTSRFNVSPGSLLAEAVRGEVPWGSVFTFPDRSRNL